MEDKRFALLIDAENISGKYIKIIMDEITNEGSVTYKRIYGDWTSPYLKRWKDVLLENSITPMQQYSYTTNKSSTDSAMIIDAMDILYSGKVEGFCLVSSDSDFTKLASRLREAGMIVIGMGKQHTPRAFVSACNQFKYIDLISQEETLEEESPQPVKNSVKKQKRKKAQSNAPLSLTPEDELKQAIARMIDDNSDNNGWMLVGSLGSLLKKRYSDFDTRNYGYNKMIQLLEGFGFEIQYSKDPKTNENSSVVYVRNPHPPAQQRQGRKGGNTPKNAS